VWFFCFSQEHFSNSVGLFDATTKKASIHAAYQAAPQGSPKKVDGGRNTRHNDTFTEKNMHDSYEKQADGIAGALCPSCQVVKPMTQFMRRLSRAQAMARGYAGNVLVDVESSLCKSCQPKRKPPSKLSNKELLSRVSTGDLNKFTYDLTIKRRHAEAKAEQRRAAYTRWEKVRAKPWMYLVQEMNREITAVKHQRYYADKRGVPDLLAFAIFYENELVKLRAWLRMCARTKTKKSDAPPEHMWWPRYVEPDIKDQVRVLWEAIPVDRRMGTRMPLIFQTNKAPDPTFNPLKEEDRLTQAKARLKTYD